MLRSATVAFTHVACIALPWWWFPASHGIPQRREVRSVQTCTISLGTFVSLIYIYFYFAFWKFRTRLVRHYYSYTQSNFRDRYCPSWRIWHWSKMVLLSFAICVVCWQVLHKPAWQGQPHGCIQLSSTWDWFTWTFHQFAYFVFGRFYCFHSRVVTLPMGHKSQFVALVHVNFVCFFTHSVGTACYPLQIILLLV